MPACLAVYLQFSGGRAEAVAQYGSLKGMALPLLTFPFGLLGSLSVLLMPEITQAHLRGQNGRLAALIDRMLRLTGYFSALAGAAFWVWGQPLAEALYGSAEAGSYLIILGPAMPLMYLESMVDGGLSFCDLAVQLLHLHRQHGAAAVQLRPAAATLAVAGRTGLCGSRQRRGRAGPAASFSRLAYRRSPLAAGGGSAGRRGDGSGLLCGGVAAGPRRRAAGRGGRGKAA